MAVRLCQAVPAQVFFRVRFYRLRLKDDRKRNAGPLRECGAPPTGRTKYVEYRGAGRPAPHLYAAPGGVRALSPLAAGSSPACRTSGQAFQGGRPSPDLPALLPTPCAPVTRRKRGQAAASGLTPKEPPPTSHIPAHTSAAPGTARTAVSPCLTRAGSSCASLSVHAPGRRMEHRPARVLLYSPCTAAAG